MSFSLRPATAADLAAITALYAHHVQTGTASFELTAPSVAEMTRRHGAIAASGLPWTVAVAADATLLGYAYAGPYRTRPAYGWTVEDSIYVAPAAQGQGVGRALLGRIIDDCTALGCRQMIAVIGDSANGASIALHRAQGFADAGVLAATGWKFGRWIDSVLMQRPLGEGARHPPQGSGPALTGKA